MTTIADKLRAAVALLTVKQVAEALGSHPQTIYRWVAEGKLICVRVGKVAEWQIPSEVIKAFHEQYPQYGTSFVHAVQTLAPAPERLMGFVNAVKGKVFEIDYASWLNHGHLPNGYTAELAHHANNPGWDIAIRGADDDIEKLLQLKATASLDYVKEAIAAHPNIDVVIPHELYQQVVDSHDAVISHLIDGHEALGHLNGQMVDAVGHAEAAGADAHFPIFGPIIVVGFAAGLNYQEYRKGKITLTQGLRDVGERGLLSVIASGAGWAAGVAAHEPSVGLPVSIVVRLFGGQFRHNISRRELLNGLIETAQDSQRQLGIQVQRPLLPTQV